MWFPSWGQEGKDILRGEGVWGGEGQRGRERWETFAKQSPFLHSSATYLPARELVGSHFDFGHLWPALMKESSTVTHQPITQPRRAKEASAKTRLLQSAWGTDSLVPSAPMVSVTCRGVGVGGCHLLGRARISYAGKGAPWVVGLYLAGRLASDFTDNTEIPRGNSLGVPLLPS